MHIDFLIDVFRENSDSPAVIWSDEPHTYAWLIQRIEYWGTVLTEEHVESGSVVTLEADFTPDTIALFLALIDAECIVIPSLSSNVEASRQEVESIGQSEVRFVVGTNESVQITHHNRTADHEIYAQLRELHHPGLVLFSSGSTGESKAAVHDMVSLLKKFTVRRLTLRSLTFLLFDHIGGVDTLLYELSNGGCIVTVDDRSPDSVLKAVEDHGVELLPTSPSFMNLMLLSGAHRRHDLSSLQIVSYGTEPMPERTLQTFHDQFPDIRLVQRYGLSELGILRSQSKSSGSLWVRVGGEGFETRVVDGTLEIKAESAMLGYLNAPMALTEDGWFHTGDLVDQDGEFLRFLGRETDIINVGGEKVYPAQVESTLMGIENVADATVFGVKNAILGNVVGARVTMAAEEDAQIFRKRIIDDCRAQLPPHAVPMKVEIVDSQRYSARFKKIRAQE